ncbi:hypothetical protein HispidOSU_029186, partial [Sigmodon hispidus]
SVSGSSVGKDQDEAVGKVRRRLVARKRTSCQGSQARVVANNRIKLEKSPSANILLPRPHLEEDSFKGSGEAEEDQGEKGLFRRGQNQ